MLYAIFFHDNTDADPTICPPLVQKHLAFLGEKKAAIRAACPLEENDGEVKSGLWLVDVEAVDQAWDLVKADPFWPTRLRDSVEIKHWAQVFAEDQTTA